MPESVEIMASGRAFGLPGLERLDRRVTAWMARHGPEILRWSVGLVFLWFGAVKFIPGLSPADELATRTISMLTFDVVPPEVSRPTLAAWETAIGVGLILKLWLRAVLLLLGLQMLGTLTPLALFPQQTWKMFPVVLTLEGQYIAKNAVLIAAGVVIGATVRGGAMVAEPARGGNDGGSVRGRGR